jgi:arylformamidase
MRIWDISAPIEPGVPTWPGDTPYNEARTWHRLGTCPVNVSRLTLSTHTATHADAPLHYSSQGAPIGQVPLEPYLGRCRVIEVFDAGRLVELRHFADQLADVPSRVLFRTYGRSPVDAWDGDFTAVSPDCIAFLAGRGVRLVGIDTPSLDPADSKSMDSHLAIEKHQMAILEGLVLDEVTPGDYELIALPLKLVNLDASPVRAILRELP